MKGRDIIVIGTSAGGLEALGELVAQLPSDLPAAIFIVQHLAPDLSGVALLRRLSQYKSFDARFAEDGEAIKPGQVYLAPPDSHMLVREKQILIAKGARENGYRPAIDPLFRSAAVTHGNRVIGIVLTGLLDDGTAGLIAVKRCGGKAIVQDPADASYPDMPQSALNNATIDHCVPIAEMGALLETLTRERPGKSVSIPPDIIMEAEIAERVLSDVGDLNALGHQVPYNCPDCGGVLWQMKQGKFLRYRCHVGHAFTAATLLAIQTDKIEETLWVALRMFEERKNLLGNMVAKSPKSLATRTMARSAEAQVHIERIRAILLTKTETEEDEPVRLAHSSSEPGASLVPARPRSRSTARKAAKKPSAST
jgi:two-component system, chemotaxis family, protein-glutamate methylesterase/glutaminase